VCRSAGAERRRLVAAAILAFTGAGTVAALGADDSRAAAPPGLPAAVEPATNRTDDAKVTLGKKLFADSRLSSDGKIS
jgi:cytochrome c peroxidase